MKKFKFYTNIYKNLKIKQKSSSNASVKVINNTL